MATLTQSGAFTDTPAEAQQQGPLWALRLDSQGEHDVAVFYYAVRPVWRSCFAVSSVCGFRDAAGNGAGNDAGDGRQRRRQQQRDDRRHGELPVSADVGRPHEHPDSDHGGQPGAVGCQRRAASLRDGDAHVRGRQRGPGRCVDLRVERPGGYELLDGRLGSEPERDSHQSLPVQPDQHGDRPRVQPSGPGAGGRIQRAEPIRRLLGLRAVHRNGEPDRTEPVPDAATGRIHTDGVLHGGRS